MKLPISICLVMLFHLVACDGTSPECRVGADCASGVCLTNGQCAIDEQDGSDAGDDSDGASDAGYDGGDENGDVENDDAGSADGAGDEAGDEVIDGGDDSNFCQPNNDSVVERGEVPMQAGLRATYRIASDVPVDTVGTILADDRHEWDLSGDLQGDHLELVELQSLTGTWFAPSFENGDYYVQLRDGEDLLGVFQITDDALLLLGVVSPEDGLARTELTYEPPVVVLSFPLEMGSTYTTETTASGLALGIYSYYYEDYESQVDAQGEMQTPFGAFDVLRVRVLLTRTVGVMVTRLRSFLFVAECFGTVATIHSDENESEIEFTQAAEVRRLSP